MNYAPQHALDQPPVWRALLRNRSAALLLLAPLLPSAAGTWLNDDRVYYGFCCAANLVACGFCLHAARRPHCSWRRWMLLAAMQVLYALVYLNAALPRMEATPSTTRAWLANLASAAAVTLLVPALLTNRIGRGKLLRLLDLLLLLVFCGLLMLALSSGSRPGEGMQRLNVGILALSLLSLFALVTRFSRTGDSHFIHVVSKYVWADLIATVLVNWICLLWFPNLPDSAVLPIALFPPMLLCYWSTRHSAIRPLRWTVLDGLLVDSLQPSALALSSVALALFAFQRHSVLVGTLILLVVLCYATRTQLFYSRLFREQSRLQSHADMLHELATRDPLTGMANRRWFEETTVRRLGESSAYPCALLMIDTDRFKEINDSRGHQAGDAVLCLIADVLQRETDGVADICIARIGGDEFTVLLPNTPANLALDRAERIRGAVQELARAREYSVTVSIGAAVLESSGSRSQLLQAADEALYRAKRDGRNAVRQ